LASRIGGDAARAELPAPPGVDPACWRPDPARGARYQQADLVLLNGAGQTPWVERATLSEAALVDTSAGIRDRLIRAEAVHHRHGPAGEHAHAAMASETWLDPALAIDQARAIAAAMRRARPEHAPDFDAGLAALERDLEDLDLRLRAGAEALAGAPVLFSHPVYAYLIRAYALDAHSLHWEPDVPPNDAQWRELEAALAERPSRVLFWERAASVETVARLETLGIESRVFDPSAGPPDPPDGRDWLEVMRANADALRGG
jgi:zinc transport system substrate-binding protein